MENVSLESSRPLAAAVRLPESKESGLLRDSNACWLVLFQLRKIRRSLCLVSWEGCRSVSAARSRAWGLLWLTSTAA